MTQGIGASLNLTLARMSSIEQNFALLERLNSPTDKLQQIDNESTIESDFKKILDGKLSDKKIDEIVEAEPVVEEKEPVIESVNLKSKLDLKSQSLNIDEIIETFSNKYNIDGDFIKAIIKQESNFNPKATSKKGAMGLMQLMPKTAKSLGVVDAYNPLENIEGGVKYLKGLLDKYDNNKQLALAAYNAGSGAVKKYGGIPPYKETQNYVNSIMNSYNKIKEVNL